MTLPRFDHFADAFNYCRQLDHNVDVLVKGERFEIQPDGPAIAHRTDKTEVFKALGGTFPPEVGCSPFGGEAVGTGRC